MISDREEAHAAGAFNAPKNIKNGPVVKKLSRKNRGVGIKLVDTVYNSFIGRCRDFRSHSLVNQPYVMTQLNF